ncbi:TPA: GspL family type II secretion system protein ExeL [Aeromonas salmonicida subsp. salmonicida]|uniref:GspL family type II secretion system protein ExeL n=1 Tax=Aeromonas salmonicida TaxID=645 RepID=UPI00131F61B9|nr:GspL family type II secretion system protein ExeL [Aeromonas salmonicida]ELI6417371.1 GspL family type II secretion system protein ExeL [Aeromonas salmonicida subsp. salmonicida]ELM3645611.1 GspL family type II secretion system protein ExeL [Aeromonas salmonicida subsp. salmonicida]QHE43814.1 GspL family type II secretion system protein ExeL [Aeromonas salmonicida subsp. salmonicida]QHE49234.1 GspL family type II secretion system protein ExeL [Aeromonas salmonicida subsp. salmonicida]QJF567
MSESLVIRLGTNAQQPVEWLVWSAKEEEIIASGTLASAHALGELRERAGGRPVVTLVPGSDLIFRRVSLPGKYSRQAAAALPYLLEEQIASDVDELHLVVLGHEGHDVDLMAVDKEKMQTWLGWLEAAGLKSQQLLPDVLALPQAADGWSALQLGKEWLLRQGPCRGIVADEPLLAMLLAVEAEPVTIHSHTPVPPIPNANWQAADPELPMLLLAKGALNCQANLLQGPYRPQTEYSRYWLQWRKVAVVAGLLLLVALTQRGVHLYQLAEQDKALKAEIRQVYTRIFPGETRIVNVRSQMAQHLKLLGQTPQDGVLLLLTELAPTFAEVPGLKPQVLRFDAARGELRLQVTAPGFTEIERFRELAGKRFEVQQGEVRSTEGKVEGALVLKGKSS